jgi:S-formylglutathione hydrolase FrmB
VRSALRIASSLIVAVPLCAAWQPGPGAAQGAPAGDGTPAWVTPAVRAPRVEQRTFESAAANARVSYHVYTPEAYDAEPERRFPVVYWLHGSGGGLPGIGELARRFDAAIGSGTAPPMLVVFPNGAGLSLWVDSADGRVPVETVVVEELAPEVDAGFRTVAERSGRLVEGFSMGGYGAARFGFKRHALFCGISIFAGGPLQREFTDAPRAGPRGRELVLQSVFGGDLERFREASPWVLAESHAEAVRGRTRIRLVIGERDETLPANRAFHEHLTALGVPHTFAVLPGVGHDPRAVLDAIGDANWEFYRELFGGASGSR